MLTKEKLKLFLTKTKEELLEDPNVIKFHSGLASTREMSYRKDYIWNVKSIDDLVMKMKMER